MRGWIFTKPFREAIVGQLDAELVQGKWAMHRGANCCPGNVVATIQKVDLKICTTQM
jgi:hypothetical protein